jgi:serine/threonine protein kinase
MIQFERRTTSADVRSLGCVLMEMTTVLKGETIASMRNFLRMRTGNYRFYANVHNVGQWVKKLRLLGSEKDNILFPWIRAMLAKNMEERPTAAELYEDIVRERKQQRVPFCGSCCIEEVDSSEVEDEDEDALWKEAADLTIRAADMSSAA